MPMLGGHAQETESYVKEHRMGGIRTTLAQRLAVWSTRSSRPSLSSTEDMSEVHVRGRRSSSMVLPFSQGASKKGRKKKTTEISTGPFFISNKNHPTKHKMSEMFRERQMYPTRYKFWVNEV
jgi:hypothetical protein